MPPQMEPQWRLHKAGRRLSKKAPRRQKKVRDKKMLLNKKVRHNKVCNKKVRNKMEPQWRRHKTVVGLNEMGPQWRLRKTVRFKLTMYLRLQKPLE